MSKMIKTAKEFQYSVNIAYDLQNPEKLRGFIPTKSFLGLLEDILLSTEIPSTNRARILIGAYGKGKSHIVLTILSILNHHEPMSDFVHLSEKLKENPQLLALVKNCYESNKRLLPVLITGSSTSLSQSFLVSLKNTLSENNLSSLMPETNYKAAVAAIKKWQSEYPEVAKQLEKSAETSTSNFIAKLEDFNIDYYRLFEKIYPSLTAGSHFNPFLGFDVVEIYESVAKELRHRGLFDGLYVVYDEFSKYLEANIESASVSDTKMLQDFAEKSCRSGENQLHILLISHKEISNYIDKLPKQKTDGWRGISERFDHILLNNNFSQVYEIISTVIQKDAKYYENFKAEHKEEFCLVESGYKKHEIFKDVRRDGGIQNLLFQTFPLHPVSTFILPRLSERIAQNERTLFTFLSAKGEATLPAFLSQYDDKKFSLVTPDLIFDYFEPLLKKEIHSGELHDIYHITSVILEKIGRDDDNVRLGLERKIIKSLSLIYILAQFEKLKPLSEEIVRIYSFSYPQEEIEAALKNLIEKEFVIYLRQSNSYLKLKETSGVDILSAIHDEIEKQKNHFSLCKVLNDNNSEKFLYPYRYNDEKEMTRYFEFRFVDFDYVQRPDFKSKDSTATPDGMVYAVLCKDSSEWKSAKDLVMTVSKNHKREIFIIPKRLKKIEKAAKELNAILELKASAADDEILSSEYQVVLEDVADVIRSFILDFSRPERNSSIYIYAGKEENIKRRAELTELLSKIFDKAYSKSPIINNEAINKNAITSMAYNSRRKILAGLLRTPLEKDLGLSGSGQDVAIMRSTLMHTKMLLQNESTEQVELNLYFEDDKYNLNPMLNVIQDFVKNADNERKSFDELYEKLVSSKNKIGARKGIIPIYMAAVFGRIKNQIVIYSGEHEIPLNADSLALINEHPQDFSLLRFELDDTKKEYLSKLGRIFSEWLSGNKYSEAESVYEAMRNWYLSLPKYASESKCEHSKFIKCLAQDFGAQELLFVKLPENFGNPSANPEVALKIQNAKIFYDNFILDVKSKLISEIKKIFGGSEEETLSHTLVAWQTNLNLSTLNHLFADGTEKLIASIQASYVNDEELIDALTVVATDLHIANWIETTEQVFLKRICAWKKTAERFNSMQISAKNKSASQNISGGSDSYSVQFPIGGGKILTRSFEKISESPRSRLLYNRLTDALDAMGQSMSESEKRQVLMDVLQALCGGET